MDVWNGTTWFPVPGVVFSGGPSDRFTWVGWGNELLVTNGVDKIVSYNRLTGVASVLVESFPARQLTTFNNRVIASSVEEGGHLGYRIRWSVKNDNTDWTSETTEDGIGAGFEDLLGAPEGLVDEVIGVYPFTDETALIVRANSMWQTLPTGNVDAPFRFSRQVAKVGSKARHANITTPNGVVVLTDKDVLLVGPSSVDSIGTPIRRELLDEITDHSLVTGAYDPVRQEYRLSTVAGRVWRYSFPDKAWTKDNYPFSILHLSYGSFHASSLTFDELEGTFDDLVGSFDDQVIEAEGEGMFFVQTNEDRVVMESAAVQDLTADSPIEVTTGLLQAASALDKSGIIEAQVEYECVDNQTLNFEYTRDGTTWAAYGSLALTPTNGPTIGRVRRTVEGHNMQVKVSSPILGRLKLISLYLFVVQGGRVNW
jgi:hypothetical protein